MRVFVPCTMNQKFTDSEWIEHGHTATLQCDVMLGSCLQNIFILIVNTFQQLIDQVPLKIFVYIISVQIVWLYFIDMSNFS